MGFWSGLRGRVSDELLALNPVIIAQDTCSLSFSAGLVLLCAQALTCVCTATNLFSRSLYKTATWVGMMGISGLPSLLALAGLVGFAFLEFLLPY
jgi:hypothetical protein